MKPLIITSVIAGVTLSFMSPFGTHTLSIPVRLVYWIGFCISGGLGAAGFERAVQRAKVNSSTLHLVLARAAGATLAVTVSLTGLSLFLNEGQPALQFVFLSLKIFLISLLICGADFFLRRETAPSKTVERPPIKNRIKAKLRKAEIYALSAEDHYVRVYTSLGDDLILLRLSDAIHESAPLPGLSPHRSWWVAEAGKQDVTQLNGKFSVILKNNQIVPVSRGRVDALKHADWI